MKAITRFPRWKIERGYSGVGYSVYNRDHMFFGWAYRRTFDTMEECKVYIEHQKGFPIYVD